MKPSDKRCPVKGCCGPVRPGRVVCRDCWRLLPGELQAAVWNAWNSGDRPSRIAAVRAALEWFKARVEVVNN